MQRFHQGSYMVVYFFLQNCIFKTKQIQINKMPNCISDWLLSTFLARKRPLAFPQWITVSHLQTYMVYNKFTQVCTWDCLPTEEKMELRFQCAYLSINKICSDSCWFFPCIPCVCAYASHMLNTFMRAFCCCLVTKLCPTLRPHGL